MKHTLFACLLLSGCAQARGSVTGIEATAGPWGSDSVRYVQDSKLQPYALAWGQALNLWWRLDSSMTSPIFPYTTSTRYRCSLVYRSQIPPFYLASDTIKGTVVDQGDLSNCVVRGGSFWLVQDGDTLLRGLARVDLTVTGCGARSDTISLSLARVSPTKDGTP